jgi:glutamine cyclotransferase
MSTRLLQLLLLVLALSLTACDSPPAVNATVAATAATETARPEATEEAVVAAPETATPDPALAEATTSVAATATAFAALILTPTVEPPTPTPTPPPVYTYEVIATYPHDPDAFTQGLVYEDGTLYEGTGLWGESTLREVDLTTGTVLRLHALGDQYFGEGIALFNDKIYQITWQEQTGFIYEPATFEELGTFSYPHEGWGITHDGQRLIVSDGTPTIRFWDPVTLQEIGRITARDDEGPLTMLNELEYVDGEIWANIWMTDHIARISPETGDVLGYIDLTGLLDTSELTQPADVLNGIAYDPATGRLFITGKLWPTLFEIEVVPQT